MNVKKSLLPCLFVFAASALVSAPVVAKNSEKALAEGYKQLAKPRMVGLPKAQEKFFTALQEALSNGDRATEAEARIALGRVRLRIKDGVGALTYFDLALEISRTLDDEIGEVRAQQGRGEAYAVMREMENARTVLNHAIELGESGGAGPHTADAHAALARVEITFGAYDRAIYHLESAFDIWSSLEGEPFRFENVLRLGDLYYQVGRYPEAAELLTGADDALAVAGGKEVKLKGDDVKKYLDDLIRGNFQIAMEILAKYISITDLITGQEDLGSQIAAGVEVFNWLYWRPPTLTEDSAYAAHHATLFKERMLATWGNNDDDDGLLTPRIQWRIMMSAMLYGHLGEECAQLHTQRPEQNSAIAATMEEEFEYLEDYRVCMDSLETGENTKKCNAGVYLSTGQAHFFNLDSVWPTDCGPLQKEETRFDPDMVGPPFEEEDAEDANWLDFEKRIKEKHPELATMSVDEVIKKKSAAILKEKDGGQKLGKVKQKIKGSISRTGDVFELLVYRAGLKIREWIANQSGFAELIRYARITGEGFPFIMRADEVYERHAKTIEAMCHQSYSADLGSTLGNSWRQVGGFDEVAQAAFDEAWAAQEALWAGLEYYGVSQDSPDLLKGAGTPTLAFQDCEEHDGGFFVALRSVALLRGQISLAEGDNALAAAFFHRAWKGSFLPEPSTPELEVQALVGLAEAFSRQGMPAISAIYLQQAIGLVESIQVTLHNSQIVDSFADAQTELYGKMIDLLLDLKEEEFTFEYAGRSRSRAFLDLIGNRPLDLHGLPEDLNAEWNSIRAELSRMQGQLTSVPKYEIGGAAKRRGMRVQRDELEVRLEEINQEIRMHHPDAAAFVSVDPLTLEKLSDAIVEEGTTLVVYFLTPQRGLTWVIERGSFQLFELPVNYSGMQQEIPLLRQRIANREPVDDTLGTLYQSLFEPLKEKISNERVLIVPHGPLHQLPFSALYDAANDNYLIEDYELTFLPSSSVTSYVQQLRNPWDQRLLALGNPDGDLPRATEEVRQIASLYGTEASLGPVAQESMVRQAAGQTDVVHLAAHGTLKGDRPLFGYIDLAEGNGDDPQNDGRLEIHEVLNEIRFDDSNLVVLSACNSSGGNQSRGDDVVSMPRAMLFAGAPSVVSTLWEVVDGPSAELMMAFHGHLQNGSVGVADSLRKAQIEMIHNGSAAPYDWAGYTVTGDPIGRGQPPEMAPGANNPWAWDPDAAPPYEPPPLVIDEPSSLPWQTRNNTPVVQQITEARTLEEKRWALSTPTLFEKWVQALLTAKRQKDQASEAEARLGLGRLLALHGDVDGGLAHLNLALAIYQDLGDQNALGRVEHALGVAWRTAGELDKSREAFQSSLSKNVTATARENLAAVLLALGDTDEARAELGRAASDWRFENKPGRAFAAELRAAEIALSVNGAESTVAVLEKLSQQAATEAPTVETAEVAALLGRLDKTSAAISGRVEAWIGRAQTEDPFTDWPDPPWSEDRSFLKEHERVVKELKLPATNGAKPTNILSASHRDLRLSPRVFRNLVMDCARLYGKLGDSDLGEELEEVDWPAECGPQKERFDPRNVRHTLARLDEKGGAIAKEATLADPFALSDKKVTYYLLGSATGRPELASLDEDVRIFDQLCHQDNAVRAHNALWRAYRAEGDEAKKKTKQAHKLAWDAAAPLWQAWQTLGWVSGVAPVRALGLPAPELSGCRDQPRGFLGRHDAWLWQAHNERAAKNLASAKAFYRKAAGDAYDWPQPHRATRIAAYSGLAETHRLEGYQGLAAYRYRRAVAITEEAPEGLNYDIVGLYENLNAVLEEQGADDVVFEADNWDGECPWLLEPPEEGLPPEREKERLAICKDLNHFQARENLVVAQPFAIGGYSYASNSLHQLRQQRGQQLERLFLLESGAVQTVEEIPEESEEDLLNPVITPADQVPEDVIAAAEMEDDEKGGGFMGRMGGISGKAGRFVVKQGRSAGSAVRRKAKKNTRGDGETPGVTLFQDIDFEGRSAFFTEDDPKLSNDKINQDAASSIEIFPGCEVTLFQDTNFEGASVVLTESVADLSETAVGNDTVSSLQVRCPEEL